MPQSRELLKDLVGALWEETLGDFLGTRGEVNWEEPEELAELSLARDCPEFRGGAT